MSQESITIICCVLVGVLLVTYPRQIAVWFIPYTKALCERPGNEWFALLCAGGVWVTERITFGWLHDATTAPRDFRLMGCAYLWIALINWFAFFVL
jgi:hypothetical protein